jgi:hypothetical protein
MPKILGNSSGKNNKSCSVFHQESNKIEFAFTKFSQTILLFKKLLFTKVPGTFCRFTTIPSVHPKHPGKNSDLALWPLGAVAGPVGEIPGRPTALAGQEWARGGPGGALGRCGRLAGAEMLPATAVGGAPGRRPR